MNYFIVISVLCSYIVYNVNVNLSNLIDHIMVVIIVYSIISNHASHTCYALHFNVEKSVTKRLGLRVSDHVYCSNYNTAL